MVEFGAVHGLLSDRDAQRGVARQGRMAARPIVVRREIGELTFEVTRVPEQHVDAPVPCCTVEILANIALGKARTRRSDDGRPWTDGRLAEARDAFRDEHLDLRLDPEARNLRPTCTPPSADGTTWRVEQILVDREGLND